MTSYGEHQLVQRIRERFCMPAFVTLANVATPSGTYADALSLNLWRSRGYELVGFEVKSVRSDWLRELKDPQKAEGVAQYCHTFWIVANPDVVKPEELPAGWGLLEAQGKGLISRQKAQVLGHRREITVPLMVSIVRRAVEKGEMTEELKAAHEAGKTEGIELGRKATEPSALVDARKEVERWKKLADDFKQRTGIEISSWSNSAKLAATYRLVDRGESIARQLGYTLTSLRSHTKAIEEARREFTQAVGGPVDATEE